MTWNTDLSSAPVGVPVILRVRMPFPVEGFGNVRVNEGVRLEEGGPWMDPRFLGSIRRDLAELVEPVEAWMPIPPYPAELDRMPEPVQVAPGVQEAEERGRREVGAPPVAEAGLTRISSRPDRIVEVETADELYGPATYPGETVEILAYDLRSGHSRAAALSAPRSARIAVYRSGRIVADIPAELCTIRYEAESGELDDEGGK